MNRTVLALSAWCGLAFSSLAQTASDLNEGSLLTQQPATGTYTYSWWGVTGRTYFIQQSEDLFTWNYLPLIESGAGQVISWGFSTSSSKLFLRLKYSDIVTGDPAGADFDGDGMSNFWEVRSGLDPLEWTDPFVNPDGDDATNLQEYVANTSPNDPAPVLTLAAPIGATLVP